ncbi:unnamed protein product [Discosporangium mesarthrocarpum]
MWMRMYVRAIDGVCLVQRKRVPKKKKAKAGVAGCRATPHYGIRAGGKGMERWGVPYHSRETERMLHWAEQEALIGVCFCWRVVALELQGEASISQELFLVDGC